MSPIDREAQFLTALTARLKDEPEFVKLAKALELGPDALTQLVMKLAVNPDAEPDAPPIKKGKGRPAVKPSDFALAIKQAIAAAREADPSLFLEVKKQQVKVTRPDDQRVADPKLASDLKKLLRFGGKT